VAKTVMLMRDWQREIAGGTPQTLDDFGGPSPGGAACELGVSRQRIHQLLKEGKLDAIYLRDHLGAVPNVVMITSTSIKRFLASKPGVQVALLFVKAKGKLGRKR
jgi:hypothetical protein